jgi:DNA-3-methyladenine glycosylase
MRPGARASAGQPAGPAGPGGPGEPRGGPLSAEQWPDRPGLLPREFFAGPSVDVAPRLLGCMLSSWSPSGVVAVRLTEVEAYQGEADSASHAYRGPTRRNAVMYGEPGHAYVYFTYGMHFCVNLVCQPPGTASAVLLRAGAVLAGTELARQRRLATRRDTTSRGARAAGLADRDLARGPARLCQALGIDRSFDGVDACAAGSALRISPATTPPGAVRAGPRVGVSTAASVPWRFWTEGDPTVSPYRAHTPRRGNPSAGL